MFTPSQLQGLLLRSAAKFRRLNVWRCVLAQSGKQTKSGLQGQARLSPNCIVLQEQIIKVLFGSLQASPVNKSWIYRPFRKAQLGKRFRGCQLTPPHHQRLQISLLNAICSVVSRFCLEVTDTCRKQEARVPIAGNAVEVSFKTQTGDLFLVSNPMSFYVKLENPMTIPHSSMRPRLWCINGYDLSTIWPQNRSLQQQCCVNFEVRLKPHISQCTLHR